MNNNIVATPIIRSGISAKKREKIFLQITLSVISNANLAELLPGAVMNYSERLTEAYIKKIAEQRHARNNERIGRVVHFLEDCYSLAVRARRSLSFTFTFLKHFFTNKSKTHGKNKGG
jgi:hypothetical protein